MKAVAPGSADVSPGWRTQNVTPGWHALRAPPLGGQRVGFQIRIEPFMQVRSLTVLQNWDCHSCGDCCHSYAVPVTAEERARIEGQGWEKLPEFQGVPFFAPRGGEFFLNHRADGACVFLGANNLCRIHGTFGSAAKPLACRIY